MTIDHDGVPVCDGYVTREKLSELMAVGTERPALDYKATVDLNEPKQTLEFARDVAGMSSNPRGGYIVYGLGGSGQPATDQNRIASEQFDESKLRDKIKKYLGNGFDLTVAVHLLDEHPVAVLFVGRARYGMIPMQCDGTYTDRALGPSGKDRVLFRVGEIFVRRGTQTIRVAPSDLPRLLAPDLEAAREQGRHEAAEAFARAGAGAVGAAIAQGPPGAITWKLPQADFDGAVVQAIRSSDQVALRAAMLPLAAEGVAMAADPSRNSDLRTLLNRVISAAALGLTYDNSWLFDQSLTVLKEIYDSAGDGHGEPRADIAGSARQVWLAIGARVEALGGLAVRLECWSAVRQIALVPASGDYFVSWLRQALTEGYRGHLMLDSNGREAPGGFVAAARELVHDIPSLRPDLPDGVLASFGPGEQASEADLVLGSILQFDLSWCALALLAKPSGGTGQFYPSFATFYLRRVSPLIRRLVNDDHLRSELFSGVETSGIDAALRAVLIEAGKTAAINRFFPGEYLDRNLEALLERNAE